MTLKPRRPSAASRRRFLRLLAAGSIAALAGPSVPRRVRAETKRRARPAAPAGPPSALRAEIQSQKAFLTRTLKTIREYPLPPGSPPALVFRALAPSARARRRGR